MHIIQKNKENLALSMYPLQVMYSTEIYCEEKQFRDELDGSIYKKFKDEQNNLW